jgi:uncharacterized protein involved in exopolysaccharide biosynthesis
MQLSDYVRILARRGWLIALAVAITAGSAFIFSRLQTPIYRATQKILIQPARNDFGSGADVEAADEQLGDAP